MSYLVHLIPNRAVEGVDTAALAVYCQGYADQYGLPLRFENYLAHYNARRVIPVFFCASVSHAGTPQYAKAISVAGGSNQQDEYRLYPIWLICDRISAMAPGVDPRHQIYTRAIWHELAHSVCGLRDSDHTPFPRDLMHHTLLPGTWEIDARVLSRFRHFLGVR